MAGIRLTSVSVPDVPSEAPPEVQPVIHRRIQVVDDNLDSANTCALLLQLEGHDVMVAHEGPGALEMASEFKPEIILLDIGLPGMDGYEVAHRIRKMHPLDETLLIAVSGYSPRENVEDTNGGCFDHHLMKPVDFSQLKMLIAQVRH